MISTIYTHLIVAGVALTVGASSAWWAQGNRYELQIAKIKQESTNQNLQRANRAIEEMAGFQKGLTNALSNFQEENRVNAQAQQALGALIVDVRGTAAGLRGDFAKLPDRITAAARPALAEYASTCTAVFEAMAAAGGRLAESGAGIAHQAEGHAADARLMQEAWPRTKPATVESPIAKQ